jgi:hypothetical protein
MTTESNRRIMDRFTNEFLTTDDPTEARGSPSSGSTLTSHCISPERSSTVVAHIWPSSRPIA